MFYFVCATGTYAIVILHRRNNMQRVRRKKKNSTTNFRHPPLCKVALYTPRKSTINTPFVSPFPLPHVSYIIGLIAGSLHGQATSKQLSVISSLTRHIRKCIAAERQQMHHMYSSPSSSREETAQETTRVKPVVCVFTKSSPHHLSSPPTLRKTEHVPSPFPTRNLVRKPLQQAACAWYMLPTASPPPTPIDSSSAPKATTLQHQRRLPTHPLTQPPEHNTPYVYHPRPARQSRWSPCPAPARLQTAKRAEAEPITVRRSFPFPRPPTSHPVAHAYVTHSHPGVCAAVAIKEAALERSLK